MSRNSTVNNSREMFNRLVQQINERERQREEASFRPIQEMREEAKAILKKAPQLANTPEKIIESWLDAVQKEEPSRMLFHAKRVLNWGGSEVGTLVQAKRNLEAKFANEVGFTHSTVEELARGKLLLDHPSFQLGPTLFGNVIENVAIKMHLASLCEVHDDVKIRWDIMDKMANSLSLHVGFGVRMDPDLVLEVDGKLILTDIKAPSESSYAATKANVPISYDCQLNIGFDIARNLEEPAVFDEIYLGVYDHSSRQVNRINVDINQDLIDEIYEAVELFTPLVLKGTIPNTNLSHLEIKSVSDLPDKFIEATNEISNIKLAISALQDSLAEREAIVEGYTQGMTKSLEGNDFRINVGASTVRGQTCKKLNKEEALKYLKENSPVEEHADLEKIRNNASRLEKELIKKAGKANLVDFYSHEYEIKQKMSTATKGIQSSVRNEMKSALGKNLNNLIEEASKASFQGVAHVEETLANRQKWDLHNISDVITTYQHYQPIAHKTKQMLESRVDSYMESAAFQLAEIGSESVVNANRDLLDVIETIRENVLDPSNNQISKLAREAEEMAERELTVYKEPSVTNENGSKRSRFINL